MIITKESNENDWQWLRSMFDDIRDKYVRKHIDKKHRRDSFKYAAEEMEKLGIKTDTKEIMRYMAEGTPGYYRRTFEVIDTNKFVFEKMKRCGTQKQP